VDRSATIIRAGAAAFHEEGDVAFAREAWASNVKLIEGLLKTSPRNPLLWEQAAEGLCGYAFFFVEDDLEALPPFDDTRALHARRAQIFYGRCRDAALRLLELRHPGIASRLSGPAEVFEATIGRLGPDDVPGLFWLAFALVGSANMSREDVSVVADLWRIEALLRRVVALNERFCNAGAHIALGGLLASRSPMLGGYPRRAREAMERAIGLTGGRYLMHRVLLARMYAVPVGDRELFEQELRAVLATPAEIMPAERLANEIAKRRAARYLELAGELF